MIRKPKAKPVPGEMTEEEIGRELEEGLEDTLPASDPPDATQPDHKQRKKKPE